MEKGTNHYPEFAYSAIELSAFIVSIDLFIISLKNGEIIRFQPREVESFRKWLMSHRVRDISIDDGISKSIHIELKEKTKAWKNSGIEQLEKTIEIYDRDAGLGLHARRRAFVANRKHPNFQVIETDIKQRLYQTYKVRVMAEATIQIN